eukprot:3168972-Rhodomonas_salina.1
MLARLRADAREILRDALSLREVCHRGGDRELERRGEGRAWRREKEQHNPEWWRCNPTHHHRMALWGALGLGRDTVAQKIEFPKLYFL